MSAWTALLADAGFTGITASVIVAEAGLVTGHRPGLARRSRPETATATRSGLR